MIDLSRRCVVNGCAGAAVTAFAQQDLCLDHFVSRCYEGLDRLDPRGRQSGGSHAERAALKAFVEECSRRALEVSLSCQNMDNLQRGRLLDILLWAGELILPEARERTKAQTRSGVNGARNENAEIQPVAETVRFFRTRAASE